MTAQWPASLGQRPPATSATATVMMAPSGSISCAPSLATMKVTVRMTAVHPATAALRVMAAPPVTADPLVTAVLVRPAAPEKSTTALVHASTQEQPPATSVTDSVMTAPGATISSVVSSHSTVATATETERATRTVVHRRATAVVHRPVVSATHAAMTWSTTATWSVSRPASPQAGLATASVTTGTATPTSTVRNSTSTAETAAAAVATAVPIQVIHVAKARSTIVS